MSISRWSSVVACLVFVVATAPGQKRQTVGVKWHKSLDLAVRAAVKGDKPVMIHFNSDRVPECNEIVRRELNDPEVIELSRKFACVVGSPDRHLRRGRSGPCPRFGKISCTNHQRCWTKISERVSGSPLPTAPQIVFLRPDRSLMFRRARDIGGLASLMREALEVYEEGAQPTKALLAAWELANGNRQSKRQRGVGQLARSSDPRAVPLLEKMVLPEAGEVARQDTIKAIKDARNQNHLHLAVPLLREPSGQLRRNAVFALRNLGMTEAVPPMLRCYLDENTNRMKALILRTVAQLDGDNPKLKKIHRKALKSGTSTVRIHAIRACLDMPTDPKVLDQLIDMAFASTSLRMQALSCYVATELILRSQKPEIIKVETKGAAEKDGYARTRERPHAVEFKKRIPRMGTVLRKLAEQGRPPIRPYAAKCVKALDGEKSDFRSAILRYHNDAEDEIFKEY